MSQEADPLVPAAEGEGLDGPRVVAGIDFSSGARAALLFALHDAARRGVPVEAVTACRPPDYWMDFYAVGTYQPDQVRVAAFDRLRTFVAEVVPEGPQPPPKVHLHAVMGAAADVLILESQSGRADVEAVRLLVHALRNGKGELRALRLGRERIGHAPAVNRHTRIQMLAP
jgi:hypothetical protein